MPKCQCAGNACSCNIQVGDGLVVEGTGNATAPFVISLASPYLPVSVDGDGPVDVGSVSTGTVVDITLNADATSLALPESSGSRIDVILRHALSGSVLTWGGGILWEGGTAPAQSTDGVDWFTFRRLDTSWIGAALAIDAS